MPAPGEGKKVMTRVRGRSRSGLSMGFREGVLSLDLLRR